MNQNRSHLKEKSAARLKAIINELNPKVEGVRKVTLLEEVADCVLPWLEQLDSIMAQKLGKFQSIASPYELLFGTQEYNLNSNQLPRYPNQFENVMTLICPLLPPCEC